MSKKHASQGRANDARQPHTTPGSIHVRQRYLGNSYFQSRPEVTVQRKECNGSCGGTCPSCRRRKRLLEQAQTKLQVGPADDVYEREADRMADAIMRMPKPQVQQREAVSGQAEEPHIQRLRPESQTGLRRQPTEEEEEEEEETLRLQTKQSPSHLPEVTPELASTVHALRGEGQPLTESTRTFFESRFGYDFSQVRVHTNPRAVDSAGLLNAQAYTIGRDIVFSHGQYSPESTAGKRLLAHELTHVVQQDGIRAPGIQRVPFEGSRSPFTSTNYAFDTYNVTESHLSDPDIIARFNALSRDQLIEYRNQYLSRVADPTVLAFIDGLIASRTQHVTDVTVANQAAAITYEEPSTLGAGGRKHFVTVAGSGPEVIIEATLTPGIPPPSPGSITWTGATPDPANPARATVSRARAGKHEVTATAGGTSASLTVWAIFASIHRVDGPTLGFSPPDVIPAGSACHAGDFCVWATINNNARIFPPEIITDDPDRPNLAGARTIAPPGGTHPCGDPLAGGAPLRWDFSRQVNFVPGGIIAGSCGGGAGFPANNALGNDDSHADDEMNNPYGGGNIPLNGRAVPAGSVGDYDVPSLNLSHAADGAPGDTATLISDFRELVRLEYHRTWWLISHRPTWGVRFRLRKNAANHWVDDGSGVV